MHFLSLMNSMLVPAAYNAGLSIEKRKTMSFHQYWEMKVGSEMFLHISILPSFDMLPSTHVTQPNSNKIQKRIHICVFSAKKLSNGSKEANS